MLHQRDTGSILIRFLRFNKKSSSKREIKKNNYYYCFLFNNTKNNHPPIAWVDVCSFF